MNCVLVHYSEIGLKGKNRDYFERVLVQNIKTALSDTKPFVKRLSGRLLVVHGGSDDEVRKRLFKVPGIASFSFAIETDRESGAITEALDELAKGVKAGTFAVSATRSDKTFAKTSKDMENEFGDYLREKYGWRVDLTNPQVTFSIEVTRDRAFVFRGKHRGMGGLPSGSSGRLVSLLSGGIDSPVASYEMFRRGCEIIFVHFHNSTGQKDVVRDKVERLVKVLSEYQPKTRLYMVPFADIQKSLLMKVPSDYRMIVYRRMMFLIAGMVARKEKALGFVTGDSVGQVASQTLENLNCIYDMAAYPVFTPIAGDNKEDTIAKAREIGTYDISILPYSDCCSFLVAKHPQTKARLRDVQRIESGIDMEGLAGKAFEASEVIDF